ncbi:MFS transporter [Actinomadura meridiana]|uniref:MFS transporter n=1 Tax=Actinomadura meridiana TaxID=559626 RepID=UPI003CD07AF2
MTGDFFPTRERAGWYGRILAGEVVGVGFGLLVGGGIAAIVSWRVSFWFVAVLGLALAVAAAAGTGTRRAGRRRVPGRRTRAGAGGRAAGEPAAGERPAR